MTRPAPYVREENSEREERVGEERETDFCFLCCPNNRTKPSETRKQHNSNSNKCNYNSNNTATGTALATITTN